MPKPHHFDPTVLASKTVFLQRIQDCVAAGYAYSHLGTLPTPIKAMEIARKFSVLYAVHVDKNERYRRKAAGLGNARLFLYAADESRLDFALLLTKGENLAHHVERLSNVHGAGLRYRELELVRLTLKGRASPGLTWRLTGDAMNAWRERLRLHTAQYDRLELFQDWHSLYRTPGFAGVRRQVGELVAYWRREWAALQGGAPCPMAFPHNEAQYRRLPGVTKREDGMFWPAKGFPGSNQLPTLFYVRKMPDAGQRLSTHVQGYRERVDAVVDARTIE